MRIVVGLIGLVIYDVFSLSGFILVGIKVLGNEGGLIGYLLWLLIAVYGGGYIASKAGLMEWIIGGSRS